MGMGAPDIGEDFTLDPFQFVEIADCAVGGGDGDSTDFFEAEGVAKIERGGAVAHNQSLAVAGEAPAFGRVVELAQWFEGIQRIGEARPRFPR